jgi:hypothetical protein
MVSKLLKRYRDFHISALEEPMGNGKQLQKSRKNFHFLLRIEVQ